MDCAESMTIPPTIFIYPDDSLLLFVAADRQSLGGHALICKG